MNKFVKIIKLTEIKSTPNKHHQFSEIKGETFNKKIAWKDTLLFFNNNNKFKDPKKDIADKNKAKL